MSAGPSGTSTPHPNEDCRVFVRRAYPNYYKKYVEEEEMVKGKTAKALKRPLFQTTKGGMDV